MAERDPAIQVSAASNKQDVDARVKPGHDEWRECRSMAFEDFVRRKKHATQGDMRALALCSGPATSIIAPNANGRNNE